MSTSEERMNIDLYSWRLSDVAPKGIAFYKI